MVRQNDILPPVPLINGSNPTRVNIIPKLIFRLEKIVLLLMIIWSIIDIHYSWQMHLILVTILGWYIQPVIYSKYYNITFMMIPLLNHYHNPERSISSLISLGLVCGLQYLITHKFK